MSAAEKKKGSRASARKGAARKGAARKGVARKSTTRKRAARRSDAAQRKDAVPRAKSSLTAEGRCNLFLQSTVFDFVLVLIMSVALTRTVMFGFNIDETLRVNLPLMVGLCAVLLVVMFASGWSVAARRVSIIATVVLCGIYVIGASVMSGVPDVLVDTPDNYTFYAFILVVVTLLCFLLSRRPWGGAALLIAGVFTCGLMQFLYAGWLIVEALAFLASCIVSFIYRNYERSVYSADVARKFRFGSVFAFSLLIAAVFTAAGMGVFYAVVAPMEPAAQELKLFQHHLAQEVIYYTGVYDEWETNNQDLESNDTNDQQDETSQEGEGSGQDDSDDGDAGLLPQSVFNLPDTPEQWGVMFEHVKWWLLLFVLLAIAAIAGAIAWKITGRERRLRKMQDDPAALQVAKIYEFLDSRLARLKFRRPEAMTPAEFAAATERSMVVFAQDTGGVDFRRVTDVYYRAYYGASNVSADELADVKKFYRAFFKNARTHVGRFKWLWKFWRM